MKDADKKHYNIYIEQWRDITMLRLFEVFIESAPQLVLQLYILAYNRHFDKEKDWLTALSACFSLLSLSTSIVSYSKALRDASENKGNTYFSLKFKASNTFHRNSRLKKAFHVMMTGEFLLSQSCILIKYFIHYIGIYISPHF